MIGEGRFCSSLSLLYSRKILLLCAGFGQTFMTIIYYFIGTLGLSLLFSSSATMPSYWQLLLFPSCIVSMETQGQFCTQKAVLNSSQGWTGKTGQKQNLGKWTFSHLRFQMDKCALRFGFAIPQTYLSGIWECCRRVDGLQRSCRKA